LTLNVGTSRAPWDWGWSKAMNTMTHMGYLARVEFDERDGIFIGRVLGPHAMISFHGETVSELRTAYETAIEAFLRG
jgi:predicted HicB family RNase H-like nuclease